ncbi:MAG: hypothetical protein HKN09_08570 [Saprospiraceae bacterium]|nr:hypothetical protein [Saprospiraceae bacterium]
MDRVTQSHIFQFAFACLTIGLLYSRFMISLGMIFFLFGALWGGDLKSKWQSFISNKAFVAVTMVFFLYLITGLWSENTDYFLHQMRIKLPFFFLPFAFAATRGLSEKIMHRLMLFFIGMMFISSLWSVAMFLADFDHYIEIYKRGQIIPTPIHHIRYSIMISIAVLMSLYMWIKPQVLGLKYLKPALAVIALLLIAYLHLLAVRSGLMTLYVILACTVFYYLRTSGKIKWLIPLVVAGLVGIILAINFVPTIQNKIAYTKYSIEEFSKNNNIRELSDSRRLGSIIAGIELTKENPILGVGMGDLMDDTNAYLKDHYPDLIGLELLPHNQYILTSTVAGIPGLIIFIFLTCLPLVYMQGWKDFLLTATHLSFFASFMVEHTIEAQIGVAVYIFIILFSIKNWQVQPHAVQ